MSRVQELKARLKRLESEKLEIQNHGAVLLASQTAREYLAKLDPALDSSPMSRSAFPRSSQEPPPSPSLAVLGVDLRQRWAAAIALNQELVQIQREIACLQRQLRGMERNDP